MGDVPMNTNGLLSKVTSLFNNRMFSDIEFLFKNDSGHEEKLYGHKLILALRSKYFASLFYNGEKINRIEFPASIKPSFCLLLMFLYTDNIKLGSVKEVWDVYELASKYAVEELQVICQKFLLEETITMENIFDKYYYALSKKNEVLLIKCKEFVCKETEVVLKLINEASFEVVEDIVKLDFLSISTELDVIRAVLMWGRTECQRKNIPADDKSLRKCVLPFMKYLRFLTLNEREFQSLAEEFDIFTSYETIVLTRKMMQPNTDIGIPQTMCSITTKRSAPSLAMKTSVDSDNKLVKLKEQETFKSQPAVSYKVKKVSSLSNINANNLNPVPFPAPNTKIVFDLPGMKSYEDYSKQTRVSHQEFISFPLRECSPSNKVPFQRDIKCTVNFKMVKGNFIIHGFELQVLKTEESFKKFEVDVSLTGFGQKNFSDSYKKEFKNERCTIMLPPNMKLMENNKGLLEVSIDNFSLTGSYACLAKNQKCELNSSLKFACQISLNSNQKCGGDGFFFLINRLLYSFT